MLPLKNTIGSPVGMKQPATRQPKRLTALDWTAC